MLHVQSLPQKVAGGGSVPAKNKSKHAQDAATSISTNPSASATVRPATDTVDTGTVHGKAKRKYIDESDEQEAWAQGRFDIVFSSHKLWHTVVLLGARMHVRGILPLSIQGTSVFFHIKFFHNCAQHQSEFLRRILFFNFF